MADTAAEYIIQHVIKKCKEESEIGKVLIPIENYKERACLYTGKDLKGHNFICHLENPEVKLSILDRKKILLLLKGRYEKKAEVTYNTLQILLKDELPFEEFMYNMKAAGFLNIKTAISFIVMEDPKVTFERFRFLQKIIKFRAKSKHIYYLDERIMKKNFPKPTNDATKGEMVFFHVVSEDGYENGLFTCEVTLDSYLKWVSNVMVPSLKPSSVVVMDNNPIHGFSEPKTITRYHNKNNMMELLKNNNIPFNPNMHKAELFDLITKCSLIMPRKNIENVLKANGHEVLRLPASLDDLSLTQQIWADILSASQHENIFSEEKDAFALKEIVYSFIKELTPKVWMTYNQIIKNVEKDLIVLDSEMQNLTDKYDVAVDTECFDDRMFWQ